MSTFNFGRTFFAGFAALVLSLGVVAVGANQAPHSVAAAKELVA